MVKIIENYTIHNQIGEGEYGKVFRAVDSRTQAEIAVKVVNVKKFKEYPKLEECTLNEIQVLSKIKCPHIVKFIEILKTANNFYFFYQFCNDGTLEEYIKVKGPLPEKDVLNILQQITQAFKILSANNIMHRDLKPSNILMHNNQIKIADFGFCKSLEHHRDLAQTMLGSPIYMAPEILKGEIYTIKADIWSLGVVIYEMVYGFCPFEESSIARLINLLDVQDIIFNPQINYISPELQELIQRMLVKDHFKRIGWDGVFQYRIKNERIYKDMDQPRKTEERNPLAEKFVQKKNSPKMMMKKKFEFQEKESENNTIHEKLTYFIKVVCELIKKDYYPEVAAQLSFKLYQLILKEHSKLPATKDFLRQRTALEEAIALFQQETQTTVQSNSGPLLTRYIKDLQKNHIEDFMVSSQKTQILIHCLKLLDFNELSCLQDPNSYELMPKDRLVREFTQKSIRNVI